MAEPNFPQSVFVTVRGDVDDAYLDVAYTPEEAIEDDGPTHVATYKFVGVNILSKKVVVEEVQNG